MIGRYVWRDLRRNPRRSLTALAGMTLGIGLFSAVLFFIDGSSATMTARAIAPIPIDMQRVLSDPLGNRVRLTEQVTPSQLQPGQHGHVTLILANNSSHPANEVVIRDEPVPPLSYVPNSMTIDGRRVPDYGGEFPLAQGEAKLGLNLGTVRPKSKITLEFDVVADAAVESVPALGPSASFSSREIGDPTRANTSDPLSLDELTSKISQIPGVARAEPLSFVDLDPGSLSAGANRPPEAVRVFGLDKQYIEQDPSIRIVEGAYEPGSGLLSAEAARALAVRPRRCRPGTRTRHARAAQRTHQRHHRRLASKVAVLQPRGKAARAVRLRPEHRDRRTRGLRQDDRAGLPERGNRARHHPA